MKNQSQSNGMRDVQSVFSRTDVLVIPADEEQEIAMQAVHATGLQVEEVPPAVDSAFTEKTSHDRVGQIYLAPMTEDTGLVTATFGRLALRLRLIRGGGSREREKGSMPQRLCYPQGSSGASCRGGTSTPAQRCRSCPSPRVVRTPSSRGWLSTCS